MREWKLISVELAGDEQIMGLSSPAPRECDAFKNNKTWFQELFPGCIVMEGSTANDGVQTLTLDVYELGTTFQVLQKWIQTLQDSAVACLIQGMKNPKLTQLSLTSSRQPFSVTIGQRGRDHTHTTTESVKMPFE